MIDQVGLDSDSSICLINDLSYAHKQVETFQLLISTRFSSLQAAHEFSIHSSDLLPCFKTLSVRCCSKFEEQNKRKI